MSWSETDIRSWVCNNRIKTVDSTRKKTTQNPYCTHNFQTKWGESGEGNVQSCPSSHVEHNKGDSLSSSHVPPVISNDNYLDYSIAHWCTLHGLWMSNFYSYMHFHQVSREFQTKMKQPMKMSHQDKPLSFFTFKFPGHLKLKLQTH